MNRRSQLPFRFHTRARTGGLVVCLLLVGLPGAGAEARSPVFGPDAEYPAGVGALSVVTTDFDGDGVLDLAVPNHMENTLSIYMGNGDGTFRVVPKPSTTDMPQFAAVGDFDEEGWVDIVTADRNGSSTLLLGNGDGTFERSHLVWGMATKPSAVAVDDFNRDGHADIAVILDGRSEVLVTHGRGDGTFEPPLATPTSYGINVGLTAADLDQDGYPDLVGTRGVDILLNRGHGVFERARHGGIGACTPNNSVIGDFNEDGHPDVAFSCSLSYSDQLRILYGKGDGSFWPYQKVGLVNQVNAAAIAVTVGDFNGDCHLDLATADGATGAMGSIGVLPGGGDGTFDHAQQFEAGRRPHFLRTGDFNGDGMTISRSPTTATRRGASTRGR